MAVFQSKFDICNAGPLIDECQSHPAPYAVIHQVNFYFAAAAVIELVARQFARRGNDLGLID
jgi:hypothetical protein